MMAACTTTDVGGPCPVPRTACPGRAPGTAVVLGNSIYERSAAPLGSSGRWESRSRSWLSRRALDAERQARMLAWGDDPPYDHQSFQQLSDTIATAPRICQGTVRGMNPAHLSQQLQCRFDVLISFREYQIRRPSLAVSLPWINCWAADFRAAQSARSAGTNPATGRPSLLLPRAEHSNFLWPRIG